MTYVQSIDPGLVNLSISTFRILKNNSFKLRKLEIQKILNFRNILQFIRNDITMLIIERQPRKSTLYGICLYLEGWCKAKNIKFKIGKPCKGKTYSERKKKSIELLNTRDHNLFYDVKKTFGPKLDDVSDAFNLGYNIISKDKNYYHSTNINLYSYKN